MKKAKTLDDVMKVSIPELVLTVNIRRDTSAYGDVGIAWLDWKVPASRFGNRMHFSERRPGLAFDQTLLIIEGQNSIERAAVLDKTFRGPESRRGVRVAASSDDAALGAAEHLEMPIAIGAGHHLPAAYLAIETDQLLQGAGRLTRSFGRFLRHGDEEYAAPAIALRRISEPLGSAATGR